MIKDKNFLNKVSITGFIIVIGVLVGLNIEFNNSFCKVEKAYGYINELNVTNNNKSNSGTTIKSTNSDKTYSSKSKDISEKDGNTIINNRIVKVNGNMVYSMNKNISDEAKAIVDTDMSDFVSNFKDIANSKYKNDIERLEKTGVVNGTSKNTYEPKKSVSRAEFLAMVLQANGYSVSMVPNSLPFKDVKLDSWQARVINTALKHNLISGDKNTSGEKVFRPNDPISKIEAMAMTLSVRDFEVPSDFKHSYSDAAAKWQNKVLNNVEYLKLNIENSKMFKPNSNINRDAMAHFIISVIRLY